MRSARTSDKACALNHTSSMLWKSDSSKIHVKTALCIPTLNAGPHAAKLAAAIVEQTLRPDIFLVIDSGSGDDTVESFKMAGARIYSIDGREFNHGGTRQTAVEMLADADLIVFLTQDAVPDTKDAFERLVACFDDPGVAAAYGRQVPRTGAGSLEAHARLFNYPAESRVRSLADRQAFGIKTAFISNSFAAWRRADLMRIGGFPQKLIMGEDTCSAGLLLLAGKKIAYCADAVVRHSHNYSFVEEFRRYFDTGVLHAREAWIQEQFGGPGGEGLRFLMSELGYLWRKDRRLLLSAIVRTAFKLAGYRLGLYERILPLAFKRQLSMLRTFWRA
jgi:rhamnosyltransferase